MKFIIKPRGYGKTSDLIRLASTSGIPILVPSSGTKKYYESLCKKLKIDSSLIKTYTWNEIKNYKTFGLNIDKIFIDEIDSIMSIILSEYGITPDLCTLTIN